MRHRVRRNQWLITDLRMFVWIILGFICGVSLWRLIRQNRDSGTWIREGVLARSYPRREPDLVELRDMGVIYMVNLHKRPHDPALLGQYGMQEFHLPVQDFAAPSQDALLDGVQAIDDALGRRDRVCVHCGAGKGRTGTLIACWLVRSEGLDARQAVAEVRRLRPGSIETPAQVRAIRRFVELEHHRLWHNSAT